jgi:O-antigen/teichoic acid export membrane protein
LKNEPTSAYRGLATLHYSRMETTSSFIAMSAATNLSPAPVLAETPPAASAASSAAEFRSRMGKISWQSAVYFAGTILTTGAGYFFRIYLARTLGVEALGLYALGMSIVGMVALVNAFGLPAAAAKFIAEYSAKRDYARIGTFLRGSLGLLAGANVLLVFLMITGGPWLALHFYHSPKLSAYFWPFTLIMLIGVFTTFLGQVMAGYQDVARRTLITHFIGTPATMLFSIVLITLGFGLAGYLMAQVISAALVLALLVILVWRMTPPQARRWNGPARIERRVATFSVTAFSIAGVDFILGQADKIILGYYLSAAQVGIYALAMALVGFVPVALQSVNQIFSPSIAELHATGNHELLQQLYSTLTKWILAFTIPLGLTIMIFARPLMKIFGSAFEAGTAVLIVGTAGQLVNCAVGSVGYLLLMSGHQKQIVRIQAVNAVLIIVLSIILVQHFGIVGAAAASAIAVAVTNLWSLTAVHRYLKLFPYNASYNKLLLPAVLASVVVALTRMAGASSWLMAGCGLLLAYAAFFGTFALLGLEAADRRLAAAVWNRIGLTARGMGAFR